MFDSVRRELQAELQKIRDDGLWKDERVLASAQGPSVRLADGRDVLVERGSIWGDGIRPYVMPEDRSVSVDTELHIKLLDQILTERAR